MVGGDGASIIAATRMTCLPVIDRLIPVVFVHIQIRIFVFITVEFRHRAGPVVRRFDRLQRHRVPVIQFDRLNITIVVLDFHDAVAVVIGDHLEFHALIELPVPIAQYRFRITFHIVRVSFPIEALPPAFPYSLRGPKTEIV